MNAEAEPIEPGPVVTQRDRITCRANRSRRRRLAIETATRVDQLSKRLWGKRRDRTRIDVAIDWLRGKEGPQVAVCVVDRAQCLRHLPNAHRDRLCRFCARVPVAPDF